jgi:hypothetical protein
MDCRAGMLEGLAATSCTEERCDRRRQTHRGVGQQLSIWLISVL